LGDDLLVQALVHLVVAVAMVVVIPVGLALLGGAGIGVVRRVWLWGAVPAAVALWLPRGRGAALACLPYAGLTAALALLAGGRVVGVLWRARPGRPVAPRPLPSAGPGPGAAPGHGWPVEWAVWTALATPAVAGGALLAERAGYRLFGFDLDVLTLTEAHFHYAGFVAALVAALVAREVRPGPLAAAVAGCVPLGTGLVLLGFFVGEQVQLLGAAVLTTGLWSAGVATWREIRPAARDRVTSALLAASSAVLGLTMVLALDWAVGELLGVPHLPIEWMAATHGAANAFGFGLCSILAWRRLGTPAL
jgi:YndJ-like protein